MPDSREALPLFLLGIVVVPGEVVPLHVFEERYKTMVGECLAADEEFGIVWLSDDGVREVGCTVTITELLERDDNGRMNILTRGVAPFRTLRRIDDMPYPAGAVELLEDEPEREAGAGDLARERYAELVERVTDERPAAEELSALSAYDMAARVDLPLPAKQRLLELRSEDDRLRELGGLLAAATERLEYLEVAGERARTNGQIVRPA